MTTCMICCDAHDGRIVAGGSWLWKGEKHSVGAFHIIENSK